MRKSAMRKSAMRWNIVRHTIRIAIMILLTPLILSAQGQFTIRKAQKDILISGYTRSKTTVTVSSEVTGKVLRVNYDVGETIAKKPFFEIDPTFIGFQIESTLHSLKKLDTSVRQNESNVSYLDREFKRIDKLHKGDQATEVRRDAAKESLDQAKLDHERILVEKAVLETTVKELKERKNRHTVYAQEEWIVVGKIVEPGEIVAPGTPLARVSDYRHLVIPLFVSREEFAAIRELPDTFSADLEGKPVQAKIHWINPEFNEQTRKLSIELILVGYAGEKRGGLGFSLPLRINTEGLLVPKAAVVSRYENPRVTLKADGKTINVMILGETEDSYIIAEDARLAIGTELAGGEI